MRRVQDDDGGTGPAPCNLSAELRYEAPLATFDGDEWTEFLVDAPPLSLPLPADNHFRSAAGDLARGGGVVEADTFLETFSGSLEDLVNTFDAKITQCFRNYNEHADEIAPVQIRTQDELLADSQSVSLQFPRPTQPPTLSGTGNEYRPKCGDVLWLGSKGGYGSFHLWINVWMAGKTV